MHGCGSRITTSRLCGLRMPIFSGSVRSTRRSAAGEGASVAAPGRRAAVASYAIDEALELLHQGVSLGPSEAAQAASSGARSARRACSSSTGRDSGRRCGARPISPRSPSLLAAIYAELAIETATRSGMWRARPPNDAGRWLDRASARAGTAESAARAKRSPASRTFTPMPRTLPARRRHRRGP